MQRKLRKQVMEHPALFQSPREAYEQGMQLAGSHAHRMIPYNDTFLLQTRPTTRTGVAQIHRGRGMTVNGLQYWHERMQAADVAEKSVPVHFEPYDMGVVYAYLDGQWLECIADSFAQVHGRSEKEWNLILDECLEEPVRAGAITGQHPGHGNPLEMVWGMEHWLCRDSQRLGGGNGGHPLPCQGKRADA